MMEEKITETQTAHSLTAADQTFAFFDAVFGAVPPTYRQVDKDILRADEKEANKIKNGTKPKKQKAVSLVEINEKAIDRIHEI